MHARYAVHARTFFLSVFVSVENKGSQIQLPKLKVASSSLVARSIFLRKTGGIYFEIVEKADLSHRMSHKWFSFVAPGECQTPEMTLATDFKSNRKHLT